MTTIRRLTAGIRALFGKNQVESDMDEELRGYLDAAIREKMRSGMSKEEAERAARVEMGSFEAVKEQIRSAGWETRVESFWQDVRFGLRMLRKNAFASVVVVVTLALGIGANSAMFTLLDRTVIQPLPYAGSDRLAMLWQDLSALGSSPRARVSPATFADWRKRNRVFEQAGALGNVVYDFSGGGPPEQVQGARVTSNLIPMLGIAPLAGRTFTPDEEVPGVQEVVLSNRLWQRRFGGDRGLVGKPILMNSQSFTVIGIMPAGFHFPDRAVDYWVPYGLGLSPRTLARRNSHFLMVVARLKPGRDWRQAQSDMNSVNAELLKEFPQNYARAGIHVVSLKDDILGDNRGVFEVLLAAAACVLLIACANVANLLLARSSGRQREVTVRTSLGATPSRLLRQMLTENLLLSIFGGVLGLLVAMWSMATLQKLVPSPITASVELRLDGRALLFTTAISVLTGLLFGFAPALKLTRSEPHTMRTGRGSIGGSGRPLRDVLVIAEVALALVLVIGATLLIETLVRMRAVDPGFRPEGILTADIQAPLPKYQAAEKWHLFYTGVVSRVRSIPGVRSAGLTSELPFAPSGSTMSLSIEGQPDNPDVMKDALFRLVSAGYLETIGAKLKAGRFLEASDNEQLQPVVVVNEALARQYFPDQNPLGHRIDTGTGGGTPRWMRIVGVVANVRETRLDRVLKPAVYVPFPQTEITFFQPSEIAVLTARDPLSLTKELQKAVWSVDPEQPVANVQTMDQVVDAELAGRKQVLRLLGSFAGLALLLAALGIYGMLSYLVSQRTREIGLRMAVGATRWDVTRSTLGHAARLTGIGLAAGVLLALATTRLLATLLYQVSPLDPVAFAWVSGLILAVALIASYVPARRAAAVDPAVILREE